jgi:hypothetical protein
MKKYVWLNLDTGEFSNSWDEEMHKATFDDDSDLYEWMTTNDSRIKLICYECPNDENFEFCNLMRLK